MSETLAQMLGTSDEEIAKALSACVRFELRDHAFGDVEVTWLKDENEVATGYFNGRSDATIHIGTVTIVGKSCQQFRNLGSAGPIDRNDETGPAEFKEGTVMPKLTREYVEAELD